MAKEIETSQSCECGMAAPAGPPGHTKMRGPIIPPVPTQSGNAAGCYELCAPIFVGTRFRRPFEECEDCEGPFCGGWRCPGPDFQEPSCDLIEALRLIPKAQLPRERRPAATLCKQNLVRAVCGSLMRPNGVGKLGSPRPANPLPDGGASALFCSQLLIEPACLPGKRYAVREGRYFRDAGRQVAAKRMIQASPEGS